MFMAEPGWFSSEVPSDNDVHCLESRFPHSNCCRAQANLILSYHMSGVTYQFSPSLYDALFCKMP